MAAVRRTLSAVDWAEARSLFERCRTLGEPARRRILDEATKGRPWLRAEVESLLATKEVPDSFLGPPLLNRIPTTPKVAESRWGEPFQPKRLGKYLLLHRLGQGGMAEVFLAKMIGPQGFERLVAVKCILPHFAHDPKLRSFFQNEARLNGCLSHANIVHVYDFGEYDGACLIAMEFVNGKNLADVIGRATQKGIPIPTDIALHIVSRVCDALEYAHRRKDDVTGKQLGLVHRDISPKNVMLSFEGDVKIVDFGIARAFDRTTLTRTNGLFGTVGYLSPEAARGEPIDSRSDLFSTGVVLYELLAGERLFPGNDIVATLRQVQECELQVSRIDSLEVDIELKEILHNTLTKRPEDRVASAGAIRSQLDAYLNAHCESNAPERLTALLRTLYADELPLRHKLLESARTVSSPATPLAKQRLPLATTAVSVSYHGTGLGSPWTTLALVALIGVAFYFFVASRKEAPPKVQLAPSARALPSPVTQPTEKVREPSSGIAAVSPMIEPSPSFAPSASVVQESPAVVESAPSPASSPEIQPAISMQSTSQGKASETRQDACAEDAAALCPGKEWKLGLGECLHKLSARVSPGCLAKLEGGPLMKSCATEAPRFCPGLRRRELATCLSSHRDQLSQSCESALRK